MCHITYISRFDVGKIERESESKSERAREIHQGSQVEWETRKEGLSPLGESESTKPCSGKGTGLSLWAKGCRERGSFNFWIGPGFQKVEVVTLFCDPWGGLLEHIYEGWLARCSCLAVLPRKSYLKIKLPRYICIICYAWGIVLWKRLVRVS